MTLKEAAERIVEAHKKWMANKSTNSLAAQRFRQQYKAHALNHAIKLAEAYLESQESDNVGEVG
jgi:hypothetical protein